MSPAPAEDPDAGRILSWLHIGDLHLTAAVADNHRALLRIIGQANRTMAGRIDMAVLPGDCAEHGAAEEYGLLRDALRGLAIPLHAIPGDHDFHARSLDAFYAAIGGLRLPQARSVAGHNCLFLDMVSAGGGGPDFRLGDAQLDWLAHTLKSASAADQDSVVFMHAYPAELADPAEALAVRRLFAEYGVVCVGMGHTHYNELANDGRTIYAAARSTGQIEEGPVGFAVAAVDSGGVAWRFRVLEQAGPLVLITAPVDHRLLTWSRDLPHGSRPQAPVRALVWSAAPVLRCDCRAGDGPWQAMTRHGDGPLWSCIIAAPSASLPLMVRATDADGVSGEHRIDLPGPDFAPPPRVADGSDADRIGAWPEAGILGTQLGPNRNGRKR